MAEKTLIEFPCDFPVKIIGNNSPDFLKEINKIARAHFPNIKQDAVSHRVSKNANYLSITVTVFAENQTMLDAFYQDITKNPEVTMVL